MASGYTKFEKMDGVGIITMNRPESRNALTADMVSEIGEAIQACKRADVRAVLLTGSGGGFCSGADLKFVEERLENQGQEGLQEYIRTLANDLHTKVVLELQLLEKPVVASINGVAAGAGFSLMLGCDIRIAAPHATFGLAEVRRGRSPSLSTPAHGRCGHQLTPLCLRPRRGRSTRPIQ